MLRPATILSLLLLIAVTVNGAIETDRVRALPGQDRPLPSAMYSGYVPSGKGTGSRAHLHYLFVESEGDPATDPVVLWLNGGPGASSMWGFFAELGTFVTNDYSLLRNTTSTPAVFYNEFGWSRKMNLLVLEQPGGVGYSYCAQPDGSFCKADGCCPVFNDSTAAEDALEFLRGWFAGFPEFRSNDFFVAGESYAGVYVPMLAREIVRHPEAGIRLKGIAVGDGCMGFDSEGGCGLDAQRNFVDFMFGHGQISMKRRSSIEDACGASLAAGNYTGKPACVAELQAMHDALGGFNEYGIYDECYLRNDNARRRRLAASGASAGGVAEIKEKPRLSMGGPLGDLFLEGEDGRVRLNLASPVLRRGAPAVGTRPAARPAGGALNDYVCGAETALKLYANDMAVKAALHVPDEQPWADHDGDWAHYKPSEPDLRRVYPGLIDAGLDILIYFGDTDSGVPYNGGERWTSALGRPVIEDWRPWTTNGQNLMAGYVTVYEGAPGHNFTYATVRGASHMVPQTKPLAALVMIDRFVHGEGFQTFNGTSIGPPH